MTKRRATVLRLSPLLLPREAFAVARQEDRKEFSMTENELIEELTYACYVHNRETSPNLLPHAWKAVFPNVDAMEARYQASKVSDAADGAIYRAQASS